MLQSLNDEGVLSGPTNVLVIVANERGAKDAVAAPGVTHVGFPMSISDTFQVRNTGADLNRAGTPAEYPGNCRQGRPQIGRLIRAWGSAILMVMPES